jgi:uncharacterized integral membrane protein
VVNSLACKAIKSKSKKGHHQLLVVVVIIIVIVIIIIIIISGILYSLSLLFGVDGDRREKNSRPFQKTF